MKRILLLYVLICCVSSTASAALIPLTCKDFVLLAETAVQLRDTKISKVNAKLYLGEDEFLTEREKNQVRKMVERAYSSPAKSKEAFVAAAKVECRQLNLAQ